MRFVSLRLSLSALFRLVALTAVALVSVSWWPHATDADRDGSVAWYRATVLGKRTYYKIVNTAENFVVKVGALPGYSPFTAYYPGGSLREQAEVYVSYRTDGLHVERQRVLNGSYYAPDGTILGQVRG